MLPADTTLKAWEVQRRAWSAMGPEERVATAIRLSQAVRTTTRDGIRADHPNWSDTEVDHELLRRLYGEDVAAAVQAQRGAR